MSTTEEKPLTDPLLNKEPTLPETSSSSNILDLPKELLLSIISHVLTQPRGSNPITLRQPQERRWTNEIANLRDIPQWPTRKHPSHFPDPRPQASRKRQRKSPLLKILLVCKDFYFAGIEAYYAKNVFLFDSLRHFRTFSERLRERQRRLMERVRVEVLYCKKTKHEVPPVYVPMEAGDFASHGDLLEGFGRLRDLVVVVRMEKTSVYMVAASRAGPVKERIERDVKESWRSGRSVVRFEFPREWGLLEDK